MLQPYCLGGRPFTVEGEARTAELAARIASFARLTLELLEHAAPPELVFESQRASLDEIEHARLCFGLAERYSGSARGPGRVGNGRRARAELARAMRSSPGA